MPYQWASPCGGVPSRREFLLGIAGVMGVAAAGCAKRRVQRPGRTVVRGTVTLDGRPLGGAVMTIVSTANPTEMAGALVKGDGTFLCEDVPIGEVIFGLENDSVRASSGGTLEALPPVPDRYKDWNKSGLKAVIVEKKENVVPLEMTSKPAAAP